MRYYAIREKATGLFMPAPKDGERRTALVPTNDRPPRLFTEERHAKAFLTMWCKGIQKEHHYQDYEGNWEGGIDLVKGTARNRDDYVIVTMGVDVVG